MIKILRLFCGKILIALILTDISYVALALSISQKDHIPGKSEMPVSRESITFILGEDKDTAYSYYSEAGKYYKYNRQAHTEYLVTSCRSLLEVQSYLAIHHPANHQPWGLINLVVHGNPWLGLSVPVAPGLKRASPGNILEYISRNLTAGLEDSLVDCKTIIYICGCGLGNDKVLLDAVASFFKGKTAKPKVLASKLFEYYISENKEDGMIETHKYQAQSWYAYYRKGMEPDKSELIRKLRQHYPKASLKWKKALAHKSAEKPGDIFHYSFDVPLSWIVTYPDEKSKPKIPTITGKMKWLIQQKELIERVRQAHIPIDDFAWVFNDITYTDGKGIQKPAIWVKGYCSVICVLKLVKS
ncbi:MAG: hypothetical protein Q8907_07285 [Bacteroidota bacterium]|nr:hypothetical protein [Bacteroidota bacterium]